MQELGAADRLDYVKLSGDTMTGDLEISKAGPEIRLRKAASGQVAQLHGYKGTTARWTMALGDTNAETGSDAGSHFRIWRWNDAGTVSTEAFAIGRNDGICYLFKGLSVTAGDASISGTVNAGALGVVGNATASAYFFNGGTTAINPVSGTWQSDGTYRYNILFNLTAGQGDVSYGGTWHQPAVASFLQFVQGGSGAYFRLQNDGWGRSNNGWTTHSDIRFKFDIQPLDRVRERVEALPAKLFRKTMETIGPNGPRVAPLRVGVIAQDAEVALPEAVHEDLTLEGDDTRLSVDYGMVGTLALAGVQDLYARLDAALSRIQELERALHPSGNA